MRAGQSGRLRGLSVLFVMTVALGFGTDVAAEPAAWSREGWRTDFTRMTVPPDEIRSIIPRDRIPAIDEPVFVPVDSETILAGREPVLSLFVEGDARAYPLRIMMWHEIVNDDVGGIPVTVTYCPFATQRWSSRARSTALG